MDLIEVLAEIESRHQTDFALIPRGPLNEENLWLRVVRRSHHSHWKRRSRKSAWLRMRGTHVILLAYTMGSRWRNRAEFLRGRAEIEALLTRKWQRELDYLIKEIWAFRENRIAVRFAEWHDDSGNWFRSYGNENWEFDENGLMRLRIASINDLPIKES